MERPIRRRENYIHIRGDFRSKGLTVSAGPAVFPPLPRGANQNRLTLAQWLVSSENPLTARVTVNRVWQELFGRGIAAHRRFSAGGLATRPTQSCWTGWRSIFVNKAGDTDARDPAVSFPRRPIARPRIAAPISPNGIRLTLLATGRLVSGFRPSWCAGSGLGVQWAVELRRGRSQRTASAACGSH